MAAIVGCAGLRPVMAALEQGGTVVLANKEPLVSAGALVIEAAVRHGATLLPADSEHNAIFQCFDSARADRVRRSEEHTSELQSLMRSSYAVFCLKKKNN